MNAVRKIFSLTNAERLLMFKCYAFLWIARLGLWTVPFRVLQSFLKLFTPKEQGKVATDKEQAEQIVRATKAASNYVLYATCLTQALVAKVLLARAGYDVQLRLGVMKDEQENFQAHAWVESEGRVLIGDNNQLSEYTSLPTTSPDVQCKF